MKTKFENKEGPCPKCGSSWDDGCIIETLVAQDWWKSSKDENGKLLYPTEECFVEEVKKCYRPPYRFTRLIGIEDPSLYDGVCRWMCPDCLTQWDRFTGEEIRTK